MRLALQAFRRPSGSIVLFRPSKNAARIRKGCSRLLIPPIPDDTFVAACKEVVKYNAAYVPPSHLGALYLRPLVFGSGAKLGVAASNEVSEVPVRLTECSYLTLFHSSHSASTALQWVTTSRRPRTPPLPLPFPSSCQTSTEEAARVARGGSR